MATLTTEQVERIRQLRQQGMSWVDVCRLMDASYVTCRRCVDPEWYQARRKSVNGARQDHSKGHVVRSTSSTRSPLYEVPSDTRSLTGRVFGDPLPGRSALDQKRRSASGAE